MCQNSTDSQKPLSGAWATVQGHATAQLQLSNQSPVMCQLGIWVMRTSVCEDLHSPRMIIRRPEFCLVYLAPPARSDPSELPIRESLSLQDGIAEPRIGRVAPDAALADDGARAL